MVEMGSTRTMFGCRGVFVFTSFLPHAMGPGTALVIGRYSKCGRWVLRRDGSVVAIRLTEEEKSRSVVGTKCAEHNAISINLLELLAMVITAYVMVVQKLDHSRVEGAPVVMFGDNVSAVTWVNKCGGTRDPRAAFLMRYLGRIEMRAGWCFEAAHIPGVANVLADGISRWPRETINSRLSPLYPRVNWQEASLGKSGGTMCSGVLQAYSRRSEWLLRLTSLMKLPGVCGRSGV